MLPIHSLVAAPWLSQHFLEKRGLETLFVFCWRTFSYPDNFVKVKSLWVSLLTNKSFIIYSLYGKPHVLYESTCFEKASPNTLATVLKSSRFSWKLAALIFVQNRCHGIEVAIWSGYLKVNRLNFHDLSHFLALFFLIVSKV